MFSWCNSMCKKEDSPADNRVRAYIASLHRLTLAAREVLLAARVLPFPFGRDARKAFSPWRVGFCLYSKFFHSLARGATLSSRDATGSRRDICCSPSVWLSAMNSSSAPEARFDAGLVQGATVTPQKTSPWSGGLKIIP